jgi:formate hydrogenlyase subunit 3/multisubunit Na+/H+ antiporter MnhD subunit
MALFNIYGYFVFFYTLIAPALPWLLTRKRGASALWSVTATVVLLVVLFNALLWPACDAVSCGQGAIGIAALWVLASVSALITLMVTVALAYTRR